MTQIHHVFSTGDGLRLRAVEYPGAEGAPVLLCLPGLTRNGRDFARLAARLAPRWRVLCPDQRGRGLSDRDPDPSRYRPDQYVADMLLWVERLGISRLSVIGTSLGGMMGVMMAAARPGLVQALVLNDVGPVLEAEGLARIAGYVGRQDPALSLDEAAARLAATQRAVFPDFGDEDWRQMVIETQLLDNGRWVADYDPAIASGLANGSAVPPLWPLFEAVADLPMLLLRGALSDLLSPETAQAMQQRLPRLQAVEVPQRGHAPNLLEPVAFSALQDFLRAQTQAQALPAAA